MLLLHTCVRTLADFRANSFLLLLTTGYGMITVVWFDHTMVLYDLNTLCMWVLGWV